MQDEAERAEAFLKETLAYISALDRGIRANTGANCQHGRLARSIRSLAVQVTHMPANVARLEQPDDTARSRGPLGVWRSMLSSSDNIVPSSQYCPNPFIQWSNSLEPRRLTSLFLGAFDAGSHSSAKESGFGNAWHSRRFERTGQLDATELSSRRKNQVLQGGSPVRTDNGRKGAKQWSQ
jgi:hypothetical protein